MPRSIPSRCLHSMLARWRAGPFVARAQARFAFLFLAHSCTSMSVRPSSTRNQQVLEYGRACAIRYLDRWRREHLDCVPFRVRLAAQLAEVDTLVQVSGLGLFDSGFRIGVLCCGVWGLGSRGDAWETHSCRPTRVGIKHCTTSGAGALAHPRRTGLHKNLPTCLADPDPRIP